MTKAKSKIHHSTWGGQIGAGRRVKVQYKARARILGPNFADHLMKKHLSERVHIRAWADLVTPEGMHDFEMIRITALDKDGYWKGSVNLGELSSDAWSEVIVLLNTLRANAMRVHDSEYNKQIKTLFELAESIMEGPIQIVENRTKSYEAVLDVIAQVAGEDILNHYFQTGEVALGLASKN